MSKDKSKKTDTTKQEDTNSAPPDSAETKDTKETTLAQSEVATPPVKVNVTGIKSSAMAELVETHPHPLFATYYFDRIRKLAKAGPEDLLQLLSNQKILSQHLVLLEFWRFPNF